MNLISKTLWKNGDLIFWYCPGCECCHCINIMDDDRPAWEWNGNADSPTFTPSVLSIGIKRCHCFVKDGKIEFLSDCGHSLAGKTVDIPDYPFKEM